MGDLELTDCHAVVHENGSSVGLAPKRRVGTNDRFRTYELSCRKIVDVELASKVSTR